MIILFVYFNTAIFLMLSGIHFYWAMGGRWGSLNAVPANGKTGEAIFKPSIMATLVVAFGLMTLAFITFNNVPNISIVPPQYLTVLNALIALLFLLRAVGDFRYVGFFKKVKNTDFAHYDKLYFTPICLVISTLQIIIFLK